MEGPGEYVGVDGCPGGWLAVDAAAPREARVFTTFTELWRSCRGARRILIDIPIGLTDEARACDLAAKKLLGRWNSRVFLAPPRESLCSKTYPAAARICRRRRGAGLSKQTWCIGPRIREVDEFLRATPEARHVVRECHPEICFRGLAGRIIGENKLTQAGFEARAAGLRRIVPEARDVVRAITARLPNAVKPDDVLDALVAAWTAAAPDGELRTLPEDPPIDAEGLRAEMVYRRVVRPVAVHLLPRLVEPTALAGGVVIVIDQLRASSTITAALASGAESVRPVVSVEEARAIAGSEPGPDVLLGGERAGVRIRGFDLGNSPGEYTTARVRGRRMVFTTTNGTAALAHAARARRILIGCLANLEAVAGAAADEPGTVHILCAGTHGLVGMDDVITAGAFVEALIHDGRTLVEDDSGLIALESWRRARAAGPGGVLAALRAGLGGRNLLALGLDGDLKWCARAGVIDLVPEFDPGTGLITARGAGPAAGGRGPGSREAPRRARGSTR
ncbi:MAG: DUF429 domain-containing protein [Phycisphaerales bacterium]|nr:DUF429 domain-containing protein [Phycisphaerales bacterium]